MSATNPPQQQEKRFHWLPSIARDVHIECESDSNGNRQLFLSSWKSYSYIDTLLRSEQMPYDRVIELLNRTAFVAYDAAFTDEEWWRMKNDLVLADLNDLKEDCFRSSPPQAL